MLSFCFLNHSLSLSLSVQYCVCFRLWRCLLVMSQMQDTYIHEGRASSSSPSSPKTRTDGRVWEQPTPEKHHHLVQHSNRNHIIGGWMLTSHCTRTHTHRLFTLLLLKCNIAVDPVCYCIVGGGRHACASACCLQRSVKLLEHVVAAGHPWHWPLTSILIT